MTADYEIRRYGIPTLNEVQDELFTVESKLTTIVGRVDHAAPELLEPLDEAITLIRDARDRFILEIGRAVVRGEETP